MSHYPVGFLARRRAATGSVRASRYTPARPGEPIKFFRATWSSSGRSSKWLAGFSLGAQSVSRGLFSEKFAAPDHVRDFLHFGRERDGKRAVRTGNMKEKETETDTQRKREKEGGRERERESSLMLYRVVRPTGFGPLSRFWNPSIDPLVTSGSCLHPFRVLLSQRWIQAWQRDRSSAWQF